MTRVIPRHVFRKHYREFKICFDLLENVFFLFNSGIMKLLRITSQMPDYLIFQFVFHINLQIICNSFQVIAHIVQ